MEHSKQLRPLLHQSRRFDGRAVCERVVITVKIDVGIQMEGTSDENHVRRTGAPSIQVKISSRKIQCPLEVRSSGAINRGCGGIGLFLKKENSGINSIRWSSQ